MAKKKAKSIQAKTGGQSTTIHWPVSVDDITFDEHGRIIINNAHLSAQIKHDVSTGKHVFVTLSNSGNYCVVVSKGCP